MARIIDGSDKNMVGDRVRALRLEQGLSQQALSDRLETLAIYICRGSISRIEDKQRTVTDIELYGLSEVLRVPIEAFFEKEEKKGTKKTEGGSTLCCRPLFHNKRREETDFSLLFRFGPLSPWRVPP